MAERSEETGKEPYNPEKKFLKSLNELYPSNAELWVNLERINNDGDSIVQRTERVHDKNQIREILDSLRDEEYRGYTSDDIWPDVAVFSPQGPGLVYEILDDNSRYGSSSNAYILRVSRQIPEEIDDNFW